MERHDAPQPEPNSDRQRVAEDLFDAVRALPPEQRDAAIDAGSQDPWVRAEVRSLLQFDGSTLPTEGVRRSGRFDSESCMGLSVGGFTLRRVIGVGGMGTVFEAEQELPTRKIAVKVLHSAAARPATLARFRKESEFLARLDHPNIARVIAAGTLHLPSDGSPHPYFAMELVEGGRAIARWAEESRAPRRDIVRLFATACDAVGSGHRRGIAHLDLKPSNILVSAAGELRVIDYGIAKSLGANGGDAKDGSAGDGAAIDNASRPIAGTPQYMSPEQFARDAASVDSRSDVYALGLVLYELLTKRLPYETRGEPFTRVARVVRESMPTAPRLVDSTIAADLDAIVMKAIAKDRDRRYGTASELADDLRRWLDDEPVIAAKPRPVDAAMRFVRRNPLASGLAVIAAAAIVAGTAISLAIAAREAATAEQLRVAAARANLRAAGAALALSQPADSINYLELAPADQRAWESRHIHARLANFELFANATAEVLSVAEIPATHEVLGGITGGFLYVIDTSHARPTECIDIRAVSRDPEHISIPSMAATPSGRTILCTTTVGEFITIARDPSSLRRFDVSGIIRCAAPTERVACLIDSSGGCGMIDIVSGETLAEIAGIGEARDASFSADGRVALIGFRDGRLRRVDFNIDKPAVTERWCTAPHVGGTRAVAVSPDASTMAVAWIEGRIARIDAATGATQLERDVLGGSVFDIVISPDNTMIAGSSWSNDVRIIAMDSLALTRRFGGTESHVWHIAFSADGTRLFGRIVRRVNLAGAAPKFIDCVAAWSVQGTAAIHDSEFGTPLLAAAHGPAPNIFTTVDGNGRIREFDARSGSVRDLATIGGVPNGDARVSVVARSERAIAVGFIDGTVALFARERDREGDREGAGFVQRWRVPTLGGKISGIGFTPDGTRIACGRDMQSAVMLDAADGQIAWQAELPTGKSSPDRRHVTGPIFLDGGSKVTFVTMLSESPRVVFRVADGAVLPQQFARSMIESEDGIFRPSDGLIYTIGVTGAAEVEHPDGTLDHTTIGRNGGTLCTDRGFTRLFASTRDGATRVLAFEPLEELMRLDSPAGVPLVIGFDDEADDLTMITSRGVARTWRGGSIQPSSLPADVAIPQMLRDGALPAEPEPVRPAAAATKK